MSWSRVADAVLDIRLITTAAAVTFWCLTAVGIAVLTARRNRSWAIIAIPGTIAAALGLTFLAAVLVEKVLRPFPDPLPRTVYGWSATAVLAITLLAARWLFRRHDRRRIPIAVGLVVAAGLVVTAAAGQINLVFDAYPTVRAALGLSEFRTVPISEAQARTATTVTGTPLSEQWSAPPGMPTTGAVVSASVPPTASGFSAREARIYLPPAYFTDPRPELPILVLLAGQPGSPDDWLIGGKLTQTMDAFSAQHEGLAPVVVVADGTGGQFANPLCMDSRLGNAASYLTVDVPAWVKQNLQVDQDPRAWAVAGLSYGGTCALQLATLRPDVYPTFIDISGQAEPTLGDRGRTVQEAFGGDAEAFARINPADLLTRHRFPDSAGAFVVGLDDHEYRAGIEQLTDAARAAGMDVHLTELPGGHTFSLWSAALEKEMPWLSHRLGLTS
jgi:S-formylglutathione hydrolase FrmB